MIRINRFIALWAVCAVFPFLSAAPSAFAAQEACDNVEYEAIVKLRNPYAGAYSVWDSVEGEVETDERFKSALLFDTGTVLVAGEREAGEKAQKKTLLLAEIGRNGRVLWEKDHKLANLDEVVKIHPNSKGAVVLANMRPKKGLPYIWMGVFDVEGALLYQKSLKGGRAALKAYDIEHSADGKSYILSAFSEVPGSGQAGYSVLYRVSGKGAVISDNAFVIGAENAMHDLYVLDNGEILAAGYILDARGGRIGWMTRLNKDLRIIWQQSYARGAGSELAAVYPLSSGFVAVVGTALPIGEGNRAGWVMAVNEVSGEVGWQRYFTGALHFDGRDIMVNDDGMISALFDGKTPRGSEDDEHVRLLTINPRGALFSGDAYFNGVGVDAFELLPGHGRERLIVGETRIRHRLEKMQGPQKPGAEMMGDVPIVRSAEGWLLAAPGASPYKDPCKIEVRSLR